MDEAPKKKKSRQTFLSFMTAALQIRANYLQPFTHRGYFKVENNIICIIICTLTLFITSEQKKICISSTVVRARDTTRGHHMTCQQPGTLKQKFGGESIFSTHASYLLWIWIPLGDFTMRLMWQRARRAGGGTICIVNLTVDLFCGWVCSFRMVIIIKEDVGHTSERTRTAALSSVMHQYAHDANVKIQTFAISQI